MKQKLFSILALLLMAATGAMAQTTYSVAGSNAAMFGSAWDASSTANDMTKNGDGTYSITYTNVYLDDDVQYKVVKDHSWDEAYPDLNRVINIAEAGTYTLTINFNPTTHEVYETKPGYTVSLKDGTKDAGNWSIEPKEGLSEGDQVTITYTGTKRVQSVTAVKKAAVASSVSFTVKRVGGEDPNYADGNYTVAPGTTWQQFIESGDAPACLSIGTSGIYSGKVCHDMNGSLQECYGTIIANVADKKRVKASDAIIDGATYGCSDYLGYQDHD